MVTPQIEKFDPQTLQNHLETLDGWKCTTDRRAIEKTFKFKSFAQAWAFMNKVAKIAEDMNHHPEWLNLYNRVDITLTTHDAGGVSQRDIDMAQKTDALSR